MISIRLGFLGWIGLEFFWVNYEFAVLANLQVIFIFDVVNWLSKDLDISINKPTVVDHNPDYLITLREHAVATDLNEG